MPPATPEIQRWFSEEVLPHEDALRAFLHSRFGPVEDVQDIVQESYVRLLKAHQSGPLACPRAYLFITAKNLLYKRLRQNKRSALTPLAESGEDLLPADESHGRSRLEHSEAITLLTRALQALPERCRQIMTLRKIYGLSQREVARELGVTENVVEAQSIIGMRRCADFLRKSGLQGNALTPRT